MYRDCELALVRVDGPDATGFLGAQCTIDLPALASDRWRLGAMADHRGRVLVVFRAWHSGEGWRLAVPCGDQDWVCRHLARYRLRARVSFEPERDASLMGITGAAVESRLNVAGLPTPRTGAVAARGGLQVLALPHRRWLVAGSPRALDAVVAALGDAAESNRTAWRRRRLLAGEPALSAATRGSFLPQMLGLDDLGAVDFAKGCYPGQEVIARVHSRGRVKRRLALLRLRESPPPGGALELSGSRADVIAVAESAAGASLVQAVIPWPPPSELRPLIYRTRPLESKASSLPESGREDA